MSSVQLLDKTRKIGKLLHNNNSSKVVFNDICAVMQEILDSNVLDQLMYHLNMIGVINTKHLALLTDNKNIAVKNLLHNCTYIIEHNFA